MTLIEKTGCKQTIQTTGGRRLFPVTRNGQFCSRGLIMQPRFGLMCRMSQSEPPNPSVMLGGHSPKMGMTAAHKTTNLSFYLR